MVSYLFKFNKKIEKNLQTAKNLINTGKISIEDHIITTNDDELKEEVNYQMECQTSGSSISRELYGTVFTGFFVMYLRLYDESFGSLLRTNATHDVEVALNVQIAAALVAQNRAKFVPTRSPPIRFGQKVTHLKLKSASASLIRIIITLIRSPVCWP